MLIDPTALYFEGRTDMYAFVIFRHVSMYCSRDVPNYRKTTYPANSKVQILRGKTSHTSPDMSLIDITLWNNAMKCT
jgi:hypothetical protein